MRALIEPLLDQLNLCSGLQVTMHKCEFGEEFFELLLDSLRTLSAVTDNETLFGAKEFIVAFAMALTKVP